jgi:glycosyltransferase involved in cell wall biosynthesis
MTGEARVDLGVLTFGSEQAASVRYRVLQFLPFFETAGLRSVVLAPGAGGRADYAVCWIQKKLLPMLKVRGLARRHQLVFDFDDAVWTSEKGERSFVTRLRIKARLNYVLRKSALVLAGNDFLAAYARRHNQRVMVVPTVLDTARYPPKQHGPGERLTLGWIGHSVNFRYLAALAPVLQQVARERPLRLLVVADQDFALPGIQVENRRWAEESEVADILSMDVGLMPLADDEWTRGKCGFKAIQYMAAGVPAIASPVGMNRQLIADGVDGFLAADDAAWVRAITRLQGDVALRAAMGRTAREKIQAKYSLASWGPIVCGLFQDLVRRRP